MMAAESETREDRRKRYDAVVRVVDHQTSETQPPGVRPRYVTRILSPRFEPDEIRGALKAARENGEMFAYRDSTGTVRYTPRTEAKLKRLYHRVAGREHPDQELVGRVYRAIEEVAGE